jgi:two-component system phosphate regulon response regulator PhoB
MAAAAVKRILVVDDEPVIRSLAQLSLDSDAFHVDLARDAATALELIEISPPDLIFLDLGLPGISGEDLARRLRADKRTSSIPIVYLTGLAPASSGPANAVVRKPFTPDTLRASAAAWLS